VGWLDSLLSSSLIVWIFLIGFGIHIYLKKTEQTLPEVIKRIVEFIEKMTLYYKNTALAEKIYGKLEEKIKSIP
jgi:hypothetical protein